jgi:hypothetical protein
MPISPIEVNKAAWRPWTNEAERLGVRRRTPTKIWKATGLGTTAAAMVSATAKLATCPMFWNIRKSPEATP